MEIAFIGYTTQYCPTCDKQTAHEMIERGGRFEKHCLPCKVRLEREEAARE